MDAGLSSASVSSSKTQSHRPLQEHGVPRHHCSCSDDASNGSTRHLATDDEWMKPPLLTGTNYHLWKRRMRFFLQAMGFEIWRVVVTGFHFPEKMVNGQRVRKELDEIDESEKQLIQINAKAAYCLLCALNFDESVRVATCETAKEIWDKLEAFHEGTGPVKEMKISILEHDYETFRMEQGETISEMFARFTDIISRLEFLGKVYSNKDNVRKILRSLPKTWDNIVIIIKVVKDLNRLSLDDLMGSLISHEMMVVCNEQTVKQKKSIALKASTSVEGKKDDDEVSDSDEELIMSTRKYKKFLKKKKADGKDSEG